MTSSSYILLFYKSNLLFCKSQQDIFVWGTTDCISHHHNLQIHEPIIVLTFLLQFMDYFSYVKHHQTLKVQRSQSYEAISLIKEIIIICIRKLKVGKKIQRMVKLTLVDRTQKGFLSDEHREFWNVKIRRLLMLSILTKRKPDQTIVKTNK